MVVLTFHERTLYQNTFSQSEPCYSTTDKNAYKLSSRLNFSEHQKTHMLIKILFLVTIYTLYYFETTLKLQSYVNFT